MSHLLLLVHCQIMLSLFRLDLLSKSDFRFLNVLFKTIMLLCFSLELFSGLQERPIEMLQISEASTVASHFCVFFICIFF